MHDPPLDPDEPALQVQTVKAELPAGESEYVGQVEHVASDVAPIAAEYLPNPQSRHGAAPMPALYFPATHFVQVPPSDPVHPALQLQTDAPVLLDDPTSQELHFVESILLLNSPSPHFWQMFELSL